MKHLRKMIMNIDGRNVEHAINMMLGVILLYVIVHSIAQI